MLPPVECVLDLEQLRQSQMLLTKELKTAMHLYPEVVFTQRQLCLIQQPWQQRQNIVLDRMTAYLRKRSKTDSLCPLSVLETDLSRPEVCCSTPAFAATPLLSAAAALLGSAVGLSCLGSGERLSGGL